MCKTAIKQSNQTIRNTCSCCDLLQTTCIELDEFFNDKVIPVRSTQRKQLLSQVLGNDRAAEISQRWVWQTYICVCISIVDDANWHHACVLSSQSAS